MTRYLALLLLFISPRSFALDLPAHWCDQPSRHCSARQQEIWNGFFAASETLLPSSVPGVFSGECYFNSYYQDPARKAYGLAVFDGTGSSVYFGGQFAEFYDRNPYRTLTIEQARAQGLIRFEDRFRLSVLPDRAEVNVSSSPEHFIFYWFRQDYGGKKLFLLGQADGTVLSFCELRRN